MTEDNNHKLLWFLTGAALGGAIALLYAPATGEETRRALAQRADEGRNMLSGRGQEMMDRGRELYEEGRKVADEAAALFDRGRKIVEG